jgi:hypothetical protein
MRAHMTDVVITHNPSIGEAIAAAAEHLPLASLIAGRQVAIKPNETWASRDDTTGIATRHATRGAPRR